MPRRFESYRLSRRAEADLADIYAYTATHWSLDQADRYITDIRSALVGLVDGSKRGRARADVGEGYLSYVVGAHLILYRETNAIMVVRVLHTSMDAPRHLRSS